MKEMKNIIEQRSLGQVCYDLNVRLGFIWQNGNHFFICYQTVLIVSSTTPNLLVFKWNRHSIVSALSKDLTIEFLSSGLALTVGKIFIAFVGRPSLIHCLELDFKKGLEIGES